MMNLTTKVIDDCENSPTVLKKVIVLEISNLPSIPDIKSIIGKRYREKKVADALITLLN